MFRWDADLSAAERSLHPYRGSAIPAAESKSLAGGLRLERHTDPALALDRYDVFWDRCAVASCIERLIGGINPAPASWNRIQIGQYLSRPHRNLPLERVDDFSPVCPYTGVMPTPAVLIIDDVTDIVDEMIQMLELMDLNAVGAHSIDDAVAQLRQHHAVRVVVCDLRLSGESGIEIISRVEAEQALAARQLAYLFMTGDSDQARAVTARGVGLVLTKPINPRRLIATIVDLLRSEAEPS